MVRPPEMHQRSALWLSRISHGRDLYGQPGCIDDKGFQVRGVGAKPGQGNVDDMLQQRAVGNKQTPQTLTMRLVAVLVYVRVCTYTL